MEALPPTVTEAKPASIGTHRVIPSVQRTEDNRCIDVLHCVECGTVAAHSDSGREDLANQTCAGYEEAL